MSTPRDELGCAVEIVTVGAVVQTYRVADVTTWDSGASVFYEPDLYGIDDAPSTIPDPMTLIASAVSFSVALMNRGGRLYAALNAGVTFEAATIRVWRTRNQTFDSTDDPYLAGSIDGEATGLDDDLGTFACTGPLRLLDGIQLPYRTINATDEPNAPQRSIGKVRPMRWGSWGGGGHRDSQAYCTNATNGEICILETLCPDGSHVSPSAVISTPDHGGNSYPGLDSDQYFMRAEKFDLGNLPQMASHMNVHRRTLAYNNSSSRSTTDGTYRLGGTSTGLVTIRIADPPEDTADPETPDPCETVEVTEDVDDPTIQEQCPTVPPRLPHDSYGGLRAGHFPADTETIGFDPENDLILGTRAGYVGRNPDGDTYHNNHTDFSGIVYDMLFRFGGIGSDYADQPVFFAPGDWPGGPGTQTELTYKNSPRLEQQYDIRELLASGCWENGALLLERAGKISLRRFDPLGGGSAVYAIEPRVISAEGVRLVPGRWGAFYNDVYFVAFGHPLDPTQLSKASAHVKNQDSIDQRIAAGLPPLVTYYVGEEYGRKHGLWLDGGARTQFAERAGAMCSFLSSRHAIYEVHLQPPVEEVDDVMAIELGDHVTCYWPFGDPDLGPARTGSAFIPEDDPATCLVIGRAPNLFNHTMKLRLLRLLGPADGTAACEQYGTYMAGTETFPSTLGGGAMQPFDEAGWTDAQEEYALCSGGYYGRHKYAAG